MLLRLNSSRSPDTKRLMTGWATPEPREISRCASPELTMVASKASLSGAGTAGAVLRAEVFFFLAMRLGCGGSMGRGHE